MTILLEPDKATAATLLGAVDRDGAVVDSVAALHSVLASEPAHDLVVIGPDVDPQVAFDLATAQRLSRPHLSVLLLRRRLQSTVLREAMVAGVREVVPSDDLSELAAACGRARALSQQVRGGAANGGAQKSGQIVTVFAAKGGCGKTTVATNLATSLARDGRRVCLVDLDLAFGDVAIAMQLVPSRTIADALGLATLDETAVGALVTTHESGVDTILAPVEPGTAEAFSSTLVGGLLPVLKRMYDVVVIDTPPAFTDHVLAAFDVTDHFVLLATLDIPALKNLKLTLDTLQMLGYPRERWHVVLNRSDAKVGLDTGDVERTLKTPIAALIPSSRAVPAAINRGVPIVLDQPGHPVSLAIRRFGESKIVAESAKQAAGTARKVFSLRWKSAQVTA
jgi:pilus assembly protein CpaE